MFKKVKCYFLQKSFIIYGLVGGFVTLIQISFLFLLRNFWGISEFISVTSAYIFALFLHYFLNKHVTFLVKDKKVFNMMSVRYIAIVILSYLIYITNIYIFHRIIGIPFMLALILTLGINFIVNYVLYEKVVFLNKKSYEV